MHSNSNTRLMAILEPVCERLRNVEDALPDLREYALEVRLRVDREIEDLRQTGSYAA